MTEPEKHEHAHQHLHVDAGLIAQLREGYATLSAEGAKEGVPLLAEGPLAGMGPSVGLRPLFAPSCVDHVYASCLASQEGISHPDAE